MYFHSEASHSPSAVRNFAVDFHGLRAPNRAWKEGELEKAGESNGQIFGTLAHINVASRSGAWTGILVSKLLIHSFLHSLVSQYF